MIAYATRPPDPHARGRSERPRNRTRATRQARRSRPPGRDRRRADQRRAALLLLVAPGTGTQRRRLRDTRRISAGPSLLRADHPSPPQPRRRATGQLRAAHDRPHAPQARSRTRAYAARRAANARRHARSSAASNATSHATSSASSKPPVPTSSRSAPSELARSALLFTEIEASSRSPWGSAPASPDTASRSKRRPSGSRSWPTPSAKAASIQSEDRPQGEGRLASYRSSVDHCGEPLASPIAPPTQDLDSRPIARGSAGAQQDRRHDGHGLRRREADHAAFRQGRFGHARKPPTLWRRMNADKSRRERGRVEHRAA